MFQKFFITYTCNIDNTSFFNADADSTKINGRSHRLIRNHVAKGSSDSMGKRTNHNQKIKIKNQQRIEDNEEEEERKEEKTMLINF